MTVAGWIFMIASVGFVTGLTFWSFYKTLNVKESDGEEPRQLNTL